MASTNQRTVQQALVTLSACMATAEELIGQRDATGPGFISGKGMESQPPWNTAAAYAVLIPYTEIRRLAAELTGRAEPPPGEAGTAAAIRTLTRVSAHADDAVVSLILLKIDRWVGLTLMLPAVDKVAQWEPLPPLEDGRRFACPHGCGPYALRRHIRTKVIACVKTSCTGAGGERRPWGRMETETRGPCIVWSDGVVQRKTVEGHGMAGSSGLSYTLAEAAPLLGEPRVSAEQLFRIIAQLPGLKPVGTRPTGRPGPPWLLYDWDELQELHAANAQWLGVPELSGARAEVPE